MKRNNLIAYAQSYLSFLFANINENTIKQIVLFGSVARGDFTKESDVDLFIETSKPEEIRKYANKALETFLSSDTYKRWRLRGVGNNIQIQAGKLERMSDLKRSLLADGISLYGKYHSEKQGIHYLLVAFEPISKKAKRYRVERYLFGRNEKARKTKGAVEAYGGRKLTTRSFLVPSLQSSEIIQRLKQEKVDFIVFDIWTEL